MSKSYLSSTSRTLDPDKRSFTTIVGRHDKRLTDADINLIQDLQDLKRKKLVNAASYSGCLTAKPMLFNPFNELTFFMPAMEVLFDGDIVNVAGNAIADLSLNKIALPRTYKGLSTPLYWAPGTTSNADALGYVIYLELWYRCLDTDKGTGYYTAADGSKSFYAYGCTACDPANLIPDDVIDPFQGISTTLRVQTQWVIRATPISLAYDFTTNKDGLTPGKDASETVYAQGPAQAVTPFTFANMGSVNGDYGLWRAGDGNPNNALLTLDGYVYAMPLAVVFQRNRGVFDISANPFGCAHKQLQNSGLVRFGLSGRPDGKLADAIYADDVVDTRRSTTLTGYDFNQLLEVGFTELISGHTSLKVARGEQPGNKAEALGSKLEYTCAVANSSMANVDVVGQFDSFMNGFSSDARTYYTSKVFTIQDKAAGTKGARWAKGDTLVFDLGVNAPLATAIDYVLVQTLVKDADDAEKYVPLVLYGGQVKINGVGTRTVTVQLDQDPTGTPFDPEMNPITIMVGIRYAANQGMDLRKVPCEISGGELRDTKSQISAFQVRGVSEYDVRKYYAPNQTLTLDVLNPNYSNLVFGTRVIRTISNSTATLEGTSSVTTLFKIPCAQPNSLLTAVYAIKARDAVANQMLLITRREIVKETDGTYSLVVGVSGAVSSTGITQFSLMCYNTAQVSYVAAVKGVTAIEEVVAVGREQADPFLNDRRVKFIRSIKDSATGQVTLYFAADGCSITGISGDDLTDRYIFVQDGTGKLSAVKCTMEIFGSILTIKVTSTVYDLLTAKFVLFASILPSLDANSSLYLQSTYVPYQGEGVERREYSVITTDDMATVTTNGTGAAPIPGVKDVSPFNRDLPIVTTLPNRVDWSDATLLNTPVGSEIDGNYYAKRLSNVAHTYSAVLHANDFIEPLQGYKRKRVRLLSKSGSRGFGKLLPHIGFAIKKPKPKNVLGDNLQTTIAPVTLYVNPETGSDSNDGFSKTTAKKTIWGAILLLPPVIRHPVSIVLLAASQNSYNMATGSCTYAYVGGSKTSVGAKIYSLATLAFTMQEAGRVSIGREVGTNSLIEINATAFTGFSDGLTAAFFVLESRVTFNGIKFKGFTNHAVKAIDSDVEFVDCEFENQVSVSAEQGALVTINKGQFSLDDTATGVILSASGLTVSGTKLWLSKINAKPAAFFVATRASSISLYDHDVAKTSGIEMLGTTPSVIPVVIAQNGSNVTAGPTWVTNGRLILQSNSNYTKAATSSFGHVETYSAQAIYQDQI